MKAWHETNGAKSFDSSGRVLHYGDEAGEWSAVKQGVGLYDASWRDRLLVTGADRAEFVQGLCTNDVEKPPSGTVLETAFITPKGKLVADMRAVVLDDALLFEGEPGRSEALLDLFGRYRIHEDCAFADASDSLSQLELWGPRAHELLGLGDGESKAVELAGSAYLAAGTAFGAIVFVPAGSEAELADALVSKGARPVGFSAVELRRIELGLGRYGVDWGESTNPLEAGLDRMLDYTKGCYVGQEVVAKATYIGQVARRLVRLRWQGEAMPADTVLLGGRAPGRVTSSAKVPGSDEVLALGVVRRDVTAAGSLLRLGDEEGPEVTVLGWPWLSKEKPR